jgi:putative alpha-1,2-mannosidase
MPPVPPRGILKNAKRPSFAVDYLMQKGWAPHMAQAIVGSLMRESTRNLNPAARGDFDKHTGPSYCIRNCSVEARSLYTA